MHHNLFSIKSFYDHDITENITSLCGTCEDVFFTILLKSLLSHAVYLEVRASPTVTAGASLCDLFSFPPDSSSPSTNPEIPFHGFWTKKYILTCYNHFLSFLLPSYGSLICLSFCKWVMYFSFFLFQNMLLNSYVSASEYIYLVQFKGEWIQKFPCGELKMFWFSKLLVQFLDKLSGKKIKQVNFCEITQSTLRFGQCFHASLYSVINI